MHLLQLQDGEFSLVEFVGNNIPAYGVLSHTWGAKDEELLFQDILQKTGTKKEGYRKLVFCGEQAARDGLKYFWVDSCCIDKTSSANLAEAITSMFKWYRDSAQCYVYLSDVSVNKRKLDHDGVSPPWESAFRTSRWFSRGWTLQELIAPHHVKFFSQEGQYLGNKTSLEQLIQSITRIPVSALRNATLSEFGVEERISWIGSRQTTREEDGAYSMLGILGVSMLPMYGEGKDSAFRRLRREIRDIPSDEPSPLNEEQKQSLLESLRFEQIDARQMTIKNAHAKTCKWLLRNREYLDWLDLSKLGEHHGFLWIKGKAGAGKSTLMKFALINARKTMKDCITLSFFFNARGGDLEKSTVGAYRSLLLQLLERLPALQSTFDLLGLSTPSSDVNRHWDVELLKMLLEQAIQKIGKFHVVCFIDALDECEEEAVRDMMQFFERIGETAVSSNNRFHVCFSSRHYPHITIQRGLELILEGQEGHTQDIVNYIETELKIGKSKVAKQIRSELQEKASGIFMWVVLVVGILNKAWDRGQVHALQRKLQEIPSDLHELFRDILTRGSQNKDDLVLCIQWVLFSKQPLSPEQFYHAILSGVDPDAVSAWDSEEIAKDVLKRFILDCSKGLAEITTSKNQKVQFIHESVRDFLLKENGLSKIWPEFGSGFQAESHGRLKQCCSNYINRATPSRMSNEEPESSSQERAQIRSSVIEGFPLLEYAVRNLLHHANAAEGGGVSQAQFLRSFPSPQWTRLDRLFEKHGVRRHSKNVSCLYLLAEFNMVNLIKAFRSVDQCITVEDERYGCPLLAAAATGSDQALKLCMESLKMESDRETTLPAETEVKEQHIVNRGFIYSKKKSLLSNLADFGNDMILTALVNSGRFDINLKDSMWESALHTACRNDCKNAVSSILVKDPALVNSKDTTGRTSLRIAVESGNAEMARLLITHGAATSENAYYYQTTMEIAFGEQHYDIVELLLDNFRVGNEEISTALRIASETGHEKVVKLLLNKDVHVKTLGIALYAASYAGEEHIVELLLDRSADVSMEFSRTHRTALQAASAEGHARIVKLLLINGADANQQSRSHDRTALYAASCRGYEHIVELLLDKGAVDSIESGRIYNTALQAASARGYARMVKLLLDHGAEVNQQSGYYGTALYLSSWEGHEHIVKLLLDKGVEVNREYGPTAYGFALHAASLRGYENIVKLLLDQGADIEARGGREKRTALQLASIYGSSDVVQLLLDRGADINAKDEWNRTALQFAYLHGQESTAKLLKARGAMVETAEKTALKASRKGA